MNSKILYDKSGAFYPETDASLVHNNSIIDGSNVATDLATLHAQIAALTGADKVCLRVYRARSTLPLLRHLVHTFI